MRYVGCKRRLLPFIHKAILNHQIEGQTFCDLFAGTATVGKYFKQHGYKIISNDLLYVSYVMQKVKIEINVMPSFEKLAKHLGLAFNSQNQYAQAVIDYLNALKGIEGFVYQNYSLGGTQHQTIQRLYYSDENAKKIDAIRELIEAWKQLALINDDEFFILLYALLDEASNHANTTGTMSSFLKRLETKAKRTINLKLPAITDSDYQHQVYCQNGLELLEQLPSMDILYLDPPYTSTQYATSYHLLETIARWDSPSLSGIAGKRDTTRLKSPLSSKRHALAALECIVGSHCYRHLLLSYSSDSLISHEDLMSLLQRYGDVSVSRQTLRRYNSMSPNDPRTNPRQQVEERLYYLRPDQATVNTGQSNQPLLINRVKEPLYTRPTYQ